jgi:hypothetical protein
LQSEKASSTEVDEGLIRPAPGAQGLLFEAAHFSYSDHEHAIYTWQTASKPLVIGVYVDDLLIVGPVDADIAQFKQEMKERFRMSDIKLLSYYLGIEVSQDANGISLSQSAYARRLLEKMGMEDCNPCSTPMEARLHLVKSSGEASWMD